jgi:hypothetical protein
MRFMRINSVLVVAHIKDWPLTKVGCMHTAVSDSPLEDTEVDMLGLQDG